MISKCSMISYFYYYSNNDTECSHCHLRLLNIYLLLLFIFFFVFLARRIDNRKTHEHKTYKCHCRTHNNAASAEDVGIELLARRLAEHKQEAHENYHSTHKHEQEIDFCEREIALFYIHLVGR